MDHGCHVDCFVPNLLILFAYVPTHLKKCPLAKDYFSLNVRVTLNYTRTHLANRRRCS